MKLKIPLLLLLVVALALAVAGPALAAPTHSMSGDVVMQWTPTSTRMLSFEASGTLADGNGWIHVETPEGNWLDYEVTHFNLISNKVAACWGTLVGQDYPGFALTEIVIWVQDTFKGDKQRMAWIWSNQSYNPANLLSLYWEFDPGYGTTPTLFKPISGHLKVK